MKTVRQARLQEIRSQREKLQSQINTLDKEYSELYLAEERDSYPCSCVKLNRDIEVFDMQEQSRRNRKPVSYHTFVADSLSARTDCETCEGTGIPGGKKK